jgi:hypothetical protein
MCIIEIILDQVTGRSFTSGRFVFNLMLLTLDN